MSKSPYGLTALMETINNIESEKEVLETITDVVTEVSGGVSYLDIGADMLDDEDGIDDSAEDVEDDVDCLDGKERSKLEKMLDQIEEDDDEEDIDLESLDAALEAYIQDEE